MHTAPSIGSTIDTWPVSAERDQQVTGEGRLTALVVLVSVAMVLGPIALMAHAGVLAFTATQPVGSADPFVTSGWFCLGAAVALALVPVLVGLGIHRRSKPLAWTGLGLATVVVLGYILAMGVCP